MSSEVTEVVRAELQLEPVRGVLERGGHHAGVVDQQVQPSALGGERGAELADRRQRAEVEHAQRHVRAGHGVEDLLTGRLAALLATHAEHHRRAGGGERAGGLLAEAGRGPGDQRPLAGQVDARQHLVGRGFGSEAHVAHASSMKSDAPPSSSRCLSTFPVAL